MTSLQLYQNPTQAMSAIPQRDIEIALALQSRFFSSLTDKEAFAVMKSAIVKAYVASRYESPIDSELIIITDETMKAFKNKIGSIRENEIIIAFIRGICGDYGDFKGLALPTFMKFAQSYLKEQSRVILTTPVKEEKQPSLEERFEIAKNLALNTFEDFSNDVSIDLQGATVYRFLAKLKIIDYTQDEQHEFLANAQEQVIAQRQREKFTTLDKNLRATIERELNDITLLEQKIIRKAQHNGLVSFFQSLTFEDEPKTTLLNLINEHAKRFLI